MIYKIKSKDGTQALYQDLRDGSLYIRDIGDYGEEVPMFWTDSKTFAKEAWEVTGGEYGDMEIVTE